MEWAFYLAWCAESGEKMTVKAGVVQGNLVDAKGLAALADMPGLPELRSMLLSTINGAAGKLVRLLATPGGQLARVIKGKLDADQAAKPS